MEKMPALSWKKETNFSTGDIYYFVQLKGHDLQGRDYFYTGRIGRLNPRLIPSGLIYATEFKCFEDGNNFKLKPLCGRKDFKTVEEAKAFVKDGFQRKWNATHK